MAMKLQRGDQIAILNQLDTAHGFEQLAAVGRQLADKVGDPLVREKIETLLSGKSVNH